MITEIEAAMTNNPILPNTVTTQTGLGQRLKSTRESLRLTEKDAASRLRLNSKIIPLMENEDFNNELLPPAFMRGYLRSYMRMLNIPEDEINTIFAQQTATLEQTPPSSSPLILKTLPINHSHRYLRGMTYVIVGILVALVSIWWVSHSKETFLAKPITTPAVNNAPSLTTVESTAPGEKSTPAATDELKTKINEPQAAPQTGTTVTPAGPQTNTQQPTIAAPNQNTAITTEVPTNSAETNTPPSDSQPVASTPQPTNNATDSDEDNIYTDY